MDSYPARSAEPSPEELVVLEATVVSQVAVVVQRAAPALASGSEETRSLVAERRMSAAAVQVAARL